MPVDPDDLAVTALSRSHVLPEGLSEQERTDLHTLRRTVSVGRAVGDDDRALAEPPADLWDRIAARAFDSADADTGTESDVHAMPRSVGRNTVHGDPVDGDTGTPAGGAEVVDLESRRTAKRGVLLAAAAVVALVAGVIGVSTVRSSEPMDELVASVDLQVVAGDGSGTAELREREDGLHLVVDVADLQPAEGADFFELWLLTTDGGDPQPLHKFTDTSGVIDVPLPGGVDPEAFPVVDISEELDDGDDTHSGLSILRGSLV